MYSTAREFFEAARSAALDADRIRRQLDAMEHRALSLGSGGFEPRVRSTSDPDRIGATVSTLLEQGDRLRERADEDYRIIYSACAILYGADNRSGLYALVGWPADAIYHHYLALRTWDEVAKMMGYSIDHTKRMAYAAMDYADSNGQMWTELGKGMAE